MVPIKVFCFPEWLKTVSDLDPLISHVQTVTKYLTGWVYDRKSQNVMISLQHFQNALLLKLRRELEGFQDGGC